MISRDSDRLIGGNGYKGSSKKGRKHVHNKQLGKTKNQGRSYGQCMITGHKAGDRETMTTPEHDRKQMAKHKIHI